MVTDPVHHTIVYSSHEGTTHIYRPGLPVARRRSSSRPSYRNQVKMWISKDGGTTLHSASTSVGGLRAADPTTEHRLLRPRPDAGRGRADLQHRHQPRQRRAVLLRGRRHDVGQAAPRTATTATGRGSPAREKDEVFLATEHARGRRSSHQIFRSTDGGSTCSSQGIPAAGSFPTGRLRGRATASCSMTARRDALVEPANHRRTRRVARARRRHVEAAATPRSRRTRPSTRPCTPTGR